MNLGIDIPKLPRIYIPELFKGVVDLMNDNLSFTVNSNMVITMK
jgi:hypothetical protein